MIYIEEKDGMLYKYKVDIDEERLKELVLKIEEGNFYYTGSLGKDILDWDDIDFEYTKFDQKNLLSNNGDMLGPCYELVHCSKLYIIIGRLLGYEDEVKCHRDDLYFADQMYPLDRKIDSEYLKLLSLIELLKYDGEEDLVSLIDEEIKERIKTLESKKNKFDFDKKLREAYKIKELYNQREEAASLLDISKLYESVMETISFEKVDEISKEEYLRDKGIFTLSKNQCLKIECGSYCKYEVTYNKDNMEEILNKLVKNSGFMNYEGIIISTNLECILRSILKGREDISSLLKYDSEKEEINIFRRKYSECLKEIADNMGDDIDEIIDRLMSVKAEFPYSKFNTKLTVEPQAYYDEILSELRFKLIDSESVEEVKKAVEFDEGISEEVVKLSLTKK